MCYQVQCPRCHKTTWDGCGQHAEQVMASVPTEQKCTCFFQPRCTNESFCLETLRPAAVQEAVRGLLGNG